MAVSSTGLKLYNTSIIVTPNTPIPEVETSYIEMFKVPGHVIIKFVSALTDILKPSEIYKIVTQGNQTYIERGEEKISLSPNDLSLIRSVNNFKCLNSGIFSHLTHLFAEDEKKYVFSGTKVLPEANEFKTLYEKYEILVFPLILTGGLFVRKPYSRDHVTTLIIDKLKKHIIFIDPEGYTLYHLRNCLVKPAFLSHGKVNMKIIDVWNHFMINLPKDEKWTLMQNIEDFQIDFVSCGVNFYRFARDYDGSIPSPIKTYHEVEQIRKKLLDNLIDNQKKGKKEEIDGFNII